MSKPTHEEIETIITQHDVSAAAKLVTCASDFGDYLANTKKVTTTQIRNAYGSMKKLEMAGWNEQTAQGLLLLKPRLAYAAGRHKGGVKDLQEVISQAIDFVINTEDKKSFERFCQFFEAIVAYHKCHGGK
ncbi:MAG: type III-A CRISPR-associated protein Csm2 [Thiotrichaceae bacterium]|nr:type III-A CRISPR-associated protein Csm2 [Thiotrichaceae bacterium]